MTDPQICLMCDEPIGPDDDVRPVNGALYLTHRECLLRSAFGGIGHLLDHSTWCLLLHDTDGGRTKRQSAIEVDRWLAAYGPPV